MKVERVIIMAAGFGSRMGNLTVDTPKPLVEICGTTMIETAIKPLIESGIQEIYIVVGYKKECFEEIAKKYNAVKLIENKYFETTNNISSIYVARHYLENCMILEGDQFFVSSNPITLDYEHSEYNVIWTDEPTVEWVVDINEEGRIVDCSDTGADRGWLSYGVSRWTKEEGRLLAKYIETEFEKGNCDIYWDRIPLYYYREEFDLHIREMGKYERFEIDNQEEKQQFEKMFEILKILTPIGVTTIENVFEVKWSSIKNVERLKTGLTNKSVIFSINNEKYIIRIPGVGTEKYINRKEEAFVYSVIENKGICDNNVYINSDTGIKIVKYVDNSRVCDVDNLNEMKECVLLIKKFHDLGLKVENILDVYESIEFYEKLWDGKKSIFNDYDDVRDKCFQLREFVNENKNDYGLIHGDCNPTNFLISEEKDGKKIQLIDWEYAMMSDPLMDLAGFITFNDHEKKDVDELINTYFGNDCSKNQKLLAYAYIALWGLYLSVWCEYEMIVKKEDMTIKATSAFNYAKNYCVYFYEEIKKN